MLLNKSDYSGSTMNYTDVLGCFRTFNNIETIIVEVSRSQLQIMLSPQTNSFPEWWEIQENTVHTIEYCLKLLECDISSEERDNLK